MIKIKLDSSEKEVKEFVEQTKSNPLVSSYSDEITEANVNDFALYISEKTNCNKCKGLKECLNTSQGYCSKRTDNSFVLESCRFKKEQAAKLNEHQLIKNLFIPKKILNYDLSDFDLTTPNRKKIYEYIINFINQTKNKEYCKGLYLYGPFSTGKTFILGCLANELARNNIESLIIYFPDLVVELKNSMGSPRFEELINYLKTVDVLLLDDLGSENMTPWLRDEIIGPILNFRLMEEKPVFLSTNLDPNTDELLNHFSITRSPSDVLKGTRITSRLQGLAKDVLLENKFYKR